jgi:hypothetical protein
MYWTTKEDILIICGCYRGNLTEFEERVKSVYNSGQYRDEYLKEIEIMKYLIDKTN